MLKKQTLDLFTRNLTQCSGVITTDGTKAQWNELEKAGYVKKTATPKNCPLLWSHCYDITDKGRNLIKEMKMRADMARLNSFFGGGP